MNNSPTLPDDAGSAALGPSICIVKGYGAVLNKAFMSQTCFLSPTLWSQLNLGHLG